ncbi:hypothetical protein [Vibrio sp. MEBiC08052]|uniref:hypothetical protein n=1 Tax=Vibrio sp. MEBiC08052 TaxID=1761910 RepID=UPI0007405AAF|nr:hypothetical protein [Vibrio sp. MEBiC08052]KUI98874.1 hypothetical protein VRK_22040 [Vibrio sp. MEBiC08052]
MGSKKSLKSYKTAYQCHGSKVVEEQLQRKEKRFLSSGLSASLAKSAMNLIECSLLAQLDFLSKKNKKNP